jgi:hypothetical protein
MKTGRGKKTKITAMPKLLPVLGSSSRKRLDHTH